MEPELQRPKVETDRVLRYLIEAQLIGSEQVFRMSLVNLRAAKPIPSTKDMVIATQVVLMTIGGVAPGVVCYVQSRLADRSADKLKDEAVVIVNGTHLLMPGDDGQVRVVDMGTLNDEGVDPPSAWVSTVYSLAVIWDRVQAVV